ncbi:hypothetical protein BJ165DRAFT_1400451 [Panaeolus papilionaceus]|nr:hypothetical protein BJ165DRAFT_1400451 [Panaeolus papilionaceus]
MALAAPAAATALLNGVGFTATGVTAGSLATVVQSAFYGASTGGVFSLLQSVATKTLIPPPIAMAMTATAVGINIYNALKNLMEDDSDEGDEEEGEEEGEKDDGAKRDGQDDSPPDEGKEGGDKRSGSKACKKGAKGVPQA